MIKMLEFFGRYTVNTIEVLLNVPMLVVAVEYIMLKINLFYVRTSK